MNKNPLRFLLPAALATVLSLPVLEITVASSAAAQAEHPSLPIYDGVCNTLVFAGQSKTCSKAPDPIGALLAVLDLVAASEADPSEKQAPAAAAAARMLLNELQDHGLI